MHKQTQKLETKLLQVSLSLHGNARKKITVSVNSAHNKMFAQEVLGRNLPILTVYGRHAQKVHT